MPKFKVEVQEVHHFFVEVEAAAETAILESGDNHHIFVEEFQPSNKNAKVLTLSTGS